MNTPQVKPADSIGDVFVTGYDRYTFPEKADVTRMHLEQLCKNYETAFDEAPAAEQLDAALKFVELFFCEVMECYPGSVYAQAASRLFFFVEDGLGTSEKLALCDRLNRNVALQNGIVLDNSLLTK